MALADDPVEPRLLEAEAGEILRLSSSARAESSASIAAQITTWRAPWARASAATRSVDALPAAAEASSTLQT